MDYRSLLVHVDRGARRSERIELAFGLAERFDAEVTGLFALSHVAVPTQARVEAPDFFEGLLKSDRYRSEQAARADFQAARTRHAGVPAAWRHSEHDAVDALALDARFADLVIIGQHEPQASVDSGLDAGFVNGVLLKVQRPVLLVPYAGHFESIGRRVLVAWNGAPEATRAIDSALPLLARAEEVHVAHFTNGSGDDALPVAGIAEYLARHHARVSVSEPQADAPIGSRILNHAADVGADLIVMGAWGHSRVRERLFGGATRVLLESMTAPVLMAH
jgi:nucleotide-binding universal stress UspA family protein